MSKICKECSTLKPNYRFSGKSEICFICFNEKKYSIISNVNENRRSSMLRRNYDLSLEDYDRMFTDQRGRCYICEKPQDKRLVVDHCHTSGRVRSLLCNRCNTALGLIQEDENTVLNMLSYIKIFEHLKKNK